MMRVVTCVRIDATVTPVHSDKESRKRISMDGVAWLSRADMDIIISQFEFSGKE